MEKRKTYICKETFQLGMFDDNGFDMEEVMTIEQGEIFRRVDTDFRCVGGEVRLDNEYRWIEISEETLARLFEEVEEA